MFKNVSDTKVNAGCPVALDDDALAQVVGGRDAYANPSERESKDPNELVWDFVDVDTNGV